MEAQPLDIQASLKDFLPAYPSSSRVWIYQSARVFTDEEVGFLEVEARNFCADWAAHGKALDATARVVFSRFLVLAVNPSVEQASGCSIDNLVHFVQDLEKRYNTQFFERTDMAVYHDGNLVIMPLNNLRLALKDASLPEEALVFDNSITTLSDLRSRWLIPAYSSWITK